MNCTYYILGNHLWRSYTGKCVIVTPCLNDFLVQLGFIYGFSFASFINFTPIISRSSVCSFPPMFSRFRFFLVCTFTFISDCVRIWRHSSQRMNESTEILVHIRFDQACTFRATSNQCQKSWQTNDLAVFVNDLYTQHWIWKIVFKAWIVLICPF